MPIILAIALIGAGATVPGHEPELAREIGNRRPGAPVDCLDPQNQTTVEVVDGTAIIYGHGTRLYVNRPVDGAQTLRHDDVLVAQVYRQRLCRLDTVTLFSPTSRLPRGVVTLGQFVPYSRGGSRTQPLVGGARVR